MSDEPMAVEPVYRVEAQYSASNCARSAFVWIEGRPLFAPFGLLGKLYAIGPEEPGERFVTPVTWFCRTGLAVPVLLLAALLWDKKLLAVFAAYLVLWAAAYFIWATSLARGRPTATVVLNNAG